MAHAFVEDGRKLVVARVPHVQAEFKPPRVYDAVMERVGDIVVDEQLRHVRVHVGRVRLSVRDGFHRVFARRVVQDFRAFRKLLHNQAVNQFVAL